jgi:hypothetical protein
MAQSFIVIKQGDADTLTEVITGLTSLSGYTAKMYIYDEEGVLIDTITGTINGLTITYELVNDDTKMYDVDTYNYETKLFDSSDHVYTPSSGKFIVNAALNSDPS